MTLGAYLPIPASVSLAISQTEHRGRCPPHQRKTRARPPHFFVARAEPGSCSRADDRRARCGPRRGPAGRRGPSGVGCAKAAPWAAKPPEPRICPALACRSLPAKHGPTWNWFSAADATTDALQLPSTFDSCCGETLQQDAAASIENHFRSGGYGSAPLASPLDASAPTPAFYGSRRYIFNCIG